MTEATTPAPQAAPESESASQRAGRLFRATEIDSRLLGMIGALALIWIGFQIATEGDFLTERNLWNLSVQFSAVAVMATGMVLVIVTRNIDLSVGSMVGFLAMIMGVLQAEIIPDFLGFENPATWLIALGAGLALGGLIGALQGSLVAYVGIPAFIVTLGGLLVWRGGAWWVTQGRTVGPMDPTFQLIGGGPRGSMGDTMSWIVAILACVAIIAFIVYNRRRRIKYGFPLRPVWAEVLIGAIGCGLVLLAVWIANSYPWPRGLARQYAEANNIVEPEGGLIIAHGIANPVIIMIGVALVVAFIANRRKFGRYVYAIGGNPEAAVLSGINTRWTIVKVFILMGVLAGVASAIITARLNAATNGTGELAELQVIAAAVIGGTSLSGGVGTIVGAVLGALIMQSLKNGMGLMGVDAPLQSIVVGVVLVAAVGLDSFFRRRAA
jgi:D-xylose transport system permease protein